MTLQDILNGPLGVSFVLGLAQVLPPRLGHRLAARLGSIYASWKRLPSVQAVRANQWVVAGGGLSAARLDELTRAVFQSTAHCFYDYNHNLNNSRATLALVELDPTFQRLIEQNHTGHSGVLLVNLHVSNFDLFGRAATLSGLSLQVLSYARPPAGYRMQNRIRNLEGMLVTPISIESMRQAVHRMQAGGAVVTGVDRPIDSEKTCRLLFFGRPSCLPAGYVRLALKAGVPVVVVSGQTLLDGHYRLMASEPIHMQPYQDKIEEQVQNAQSVLPVIEGMIRRAPEQWAMFNPVWPDALQEIPS
ncbi:MAG: lysophospholipid acyltransferase family protein [Chloroflexi bacterium]|nr:lysophospholipid acyltransferase family protein [Chloroflexota bacterium]